ncbi:ABC transporter ATP-binding protein [Bowmanella sp. JS7-9]|uniref:ABC transporter ATP-binding protein n=1 Tax=Pseudobowmanella zhangzhouensis TaxID=1537679 RepID=A0ABW1XKS5_9ALTE|nr:ATP-binding cassette domain-containing protein [Bowmanella sp. JS7-9]TBX24549.1 hypothetical protein TK45_04575 [Bowmanella sp. JS7-9]
MNVIQTEQLQKAYDGLAVLQGVDLQVPQGAVFAFLGNNGSGKSTTIRILTGLLRADAGKAEVLGMDITRQRLPVLAQIGALVESPALYPNLTAAECLSIACRLKNVSLRDIDRVLDVVEMRAARQRRIGQFSLGMKQRLAIAMTLIGAPKLLILDEPTNGLDPQGMQDIRTLIQQLPARQDCSVFVSSHLLDEVEKMASHVALLHKGRVIAQENLLTLKQKQVRRLKLVCHPLDSTAELLERMSLRSEQDTDGLWLDGLSSADLTPLLQHLLAHDVEIFEARWHQPSLEDWFVGQQTQALEASHAMA